MKKPTSLLLAVALFLPATSLAQHSSKAAESKSPGSKSQKAAQKTVTISGQASADGKTLLTDDDDIWVVTNPNVLAGHEGQYLSVRCQADPDKKELHVFSAKVAAREAKYMANRGDSAFRR
jgi:LysM repeat protein